MFRTVRVKRLNKRKILRRRGENCDGLRIDHQDANFIKLQDYYEIIEKLGSGSFGEVYLVRDRLKNKLYAAKFEELKKISRLYIEYTTYRQMHHESEIEGVPRVYKFFQTSDYNVMLMDRLGRSLDDLFTAANRRFELPTVFKIAEQVIPLIESIHLSGVIHRDIKPNNFMIGCGEESGQIHIMDFGLSKRFLVNDQHIPFKNGRSLIGTARYASVNMHMGLEPSRRDDLESIAYMLIYFAKGVLPWQGLKRKKGKVDIQKIGEIKMCTPIDKLCDGLPGCFRQFIEYCRSLKFEQDPDYELIKKLFVEGVGEEYTPRFEWEPKEEVEEVGEQVEKEEEEKPAEE